MPDAFEALTFLGRDEKRHLRVIAADLRRRSTVLFAGAGLSFNARRKDGSDRPLPGWARLTAEMAEELPGVPANDSALRIADLYESAFGRSRLIERLKALIPDQEYEPAEVHELIPLMGFREIITTNFDTLIERAFRTLRVNPRIVVSGQDLVASRPPRVLKLNGCFERNPQGVVITGEDFRRYDDEHPLLVSFLTNCFVENLVLFMGFSLDDPAFRAIFGRVRDILGRNVRLAYSIQGPVPRSQVGFWEDRGLNILSLYSGEHHEDLSFSDRLRLVLRALLDEAKRDLFTPMSDPVARARFGHLLASEDLEHLRHWLWQSNEEDKGDDAPQDGDAPQGDGELPRPPEVSQRPSPSQAFERTLTALRPYPRMGLAALLPPAAWSRLVSDHRPSKALLSTMLDRQDRWGFSLTADELAQVRGGLTFLRHAVGGSITWQRRAGRLLGDLLAERFHPLRSMAGAASIPWCRQIMLELASSLEPTDAAPGEAAPALLPETPVIILQTYLLAWIEEARGPTGNVARERLARAWRWLDLRCLMANDATRQREALVLLMTVGTSEDIELVLDLLIGRPAGDALARHLRGRASVWRAAPITPELASNQEGDPRQAAAEAELLKAAEITTRVRDLAPDFRFRFIAFHRDPSHHLDLYGTALDWIREQVFANLSPWEDSHKLGLVYRHHYLYQDYGDQSPGQMDWPFHKQMQDQLVALYERSESRRPHRSHRHAPVPMILHDLILALGRGKALHVMPPRQIDQAWAEAIQALETRVPQPVPWELLIHLSLPADGAEFIEKRGEAITDLIERGLIDLGFICDLWLHRMSGSGFSRLDPTERDGRPLEDAGGMGRTLAALASFLRLTVSTREWDAARDTELLNQLVRLTHHLLNHHHRHPHVRTHMVAVLGDLSAIAPVATLEGVIEGWMARGTTVSAHTSLGLGQINWRRILTGTVDAPSPDTIGAFHLTRQLLARAMGPLERRTDLGRDLQRWALTLYHLDAQARRRAAEIPGFRLPRDVRYLIQDHFSRLLAEEAAQPSLAWLSLARQVHEAGIEPIPRLLWGDDPPPNTGEPLLGFVEAWCCALEGDARLLRDWHWTLASCLGCLEPFATSPTGDAPGARLMRFVLTHLDPFPSPDAAREQTDLPAVLGALDLSHWDAKRFNAVASFLSTLLHRTRKAKMDDAVRQAIISLLHSLIDGGAVGDGAIGRVVDLVDEAHRDRVEQNHRAAILAGNAEQQAAGVDKAARFLALSARAQGQTAHFVGLEAQLIQGAAGVTRPRRDRAIHWLLNRLQGRDAQAFNRRHTQSLKTLHAVLSATDLPRPPAAAKALLQSLEPVLGHHL